MDKTKRRLKEITEYLNSHSRKMILTHDKYRPIIVDACECHLDGMEDYFLYNFENNRDTFWYTNKEFFRECTPKNVEIVNILNNINAQIFDLEKLKISAFEKME